VTAELYISKGKDAGKYVPLGKEPFVFLGRSTTNQIPIDDREISRVHCRVEVSAQGYVLRDLSSGNGSFVNDERVTEHQLVDGDVIAIGQTQITILVENRA